LSATNPGNYPVAHLTAFLIGVGLHIGNSQRSEGVAGRYGGDGWAQGVAINLNPPRAPRQLPGKAGFAD